MRRLAAAGAVVVLLALAWLAYRTTAGKSDPHGEEQTPAPPAPIAAAVPDAAAAATPAPRVVVRAVNGKVERRRAGAPPAALRVGDVLDLDDRISTDEGNAVLEVGTARVHVDARSELSVLELTAGLSRVQLRDGRISAEVPGSGGRFKVEASGGAAAAETRQGRFSMLAGGGQVTVAATEGSVDLSARDRTVTVGAGQQSVVLPNLPPSAPERIPPTLFLKVSGPQAQVQRERRTTLQGSTVPGAVVSINGVRVTSGSDGSFSATVPLREGENGMVVQVVDASGRRERQALPPVTVESVAPPVQSKVKW